MELGRHVAECVLRFSKILWYDLHATRQKPSSYDTFTPLTSLNFSDTRAHMESASEGVTLCNV